MKVDIDNLRLSLAKNYNKLINKINQEKENFVEIETLEFVNSISEDLDRIRELIGSLMLCYNEVDTNDVFGKVKLVSIYREYEEDD